MNGWTDRLAERAVLEMVRSTTEKRPRLSWAQWRKALREERTPLMVAADLRKIASGGLMQKATETRDTIIDAAALIESAFGSSDPDKGGSER